MYLSTHCSSAREGYDEATLERFCDNLERILADRPLRNAVDPDRGY